MGGLVGFTIREENGKEHRMCRWTNVMPWAVSHMGIVLKDPMHVHDVLSPWYEMADDYQNDRKDKSPMAWSYVPHAGLNPVEYGLILVDMKNNVILDMQGYTAVGRVSVVNLKNEWNAVSITKMGCMLSTDPDDKRLGAKAFKRRKADDDNDAIRFMDFVAAGRVKEVQYYDRETNSMLRKPVEVKTVKEVGRYINLPDNYDKSFVFDMSPYEIRTFKEGKTGCKQLYAAIKELGFELTEKEETAWVEYMTDRYV